MHVKLERELPAPVEETVAVVTDITRRPEWVRIAQERTRVGEGPPEAGAEYRAVDEMPPGRQVEYVQRIEPYEPTTLLVESWEGPMARRSTMRCSDAGGNTRLTVDAELSFPPPIPPLARALGRLAIGRDLKRLEARLRSGA